MSKVSLPDRFRKLFTGLDRAYGTYVFDEDVIATDGAKKKGHGITTRDLLPMEYYDEHVRGERMLGIIPIMDENKVVFAALDIDDYNLDIPAVLERVRKNRLPLVATRSKSGGLHLWLFFSHKVPAKAPKTKLEEIGDSLGFPGVEVFPKQIKIGPDDVGNWINLPWFNADNTDRYGWDDEGNEIRDFEKWLDYAESKQITLRDLNRIRVRDPEPADDSSDRSFTDGPPCLQQIAEQGVPEGTRNTVMFAMGVYAKHKTGGDDSSRADLIGALFDMNERHFDPPLVDREIEQITTNVDGGDYRYTCLQPPLKDFCNRNLCLRRKYGVRLNGETFSFGTLWHIFPVTADGRKLEEEGHWRLQINANEEEIMLDLTTVELHNYRAIKMKAFEKGIILPPFDNNDWMNILEEKHQNRQQVHTSILASSLGTLQMLISGFLSTAAAGTTDKIEILHNKAWNCEQEDRYWFKGEPFLSYLQSNRFFDYKKAKLISILKDHFDFEMTQQRVGNKGERIRIWTCPTKLLRPVEEDGLEIEPPY